LPGQASGKSSRRDSEPYFEDESLSVVVPYPGEIYDKNIIKILVREQE
jgi:hypothetical protein